jgi:hypothetical protein
MRGIEGAARAVVSSCLRVWRSYTDTGARGEEDTGDRRHGNVSEASNTAKLHGLTDILAAPHRQERCERTRRQPPRTTCGNLYLWPAFYTQLCSASGVQEMVRVERRGLPAPRSSAWSLDVAETIRRPCRMCCSGALHCLHGARVDLGLHEGASASISCRVCGLGS